MNNPLKTLSDELIQQPQNCLINNNGLKMNIAQLNQLISLLDQPIDEIVTVLNEDIRYNSKENLRNSNFDDQPYQMAYRGSSAGELVMNRNHSYGSINNTNKDTAQRLNQDLDHLLSSLSQYRISQKSNFNDSNDSSSSIGGGGSDYLYGGQIISGRPLPMTNSKSIDETDMEMPNGTATLDNNRSNGNGNNNSNNNNPPTSIPNCLLCNEPILGSSVSALDGYWHQEHFLCHSCELPLENRVYYPNENQPYCETCHINLFTDKCAYCNEPILDTALTALDQQWHPEHFFCCRCQAPFENDTGFHEYNGKPYCSDCYFDNYGYRCAGCNYPITDSFLSAMNAKWHECCFVCKICRKPFTNLNFREHKGDPYCEHHYLMTIGSICAACNRPIASGSLVNALGQRYHMNCFQCCYCQRSLAKQSFKEHNNKPYCTQCFLKLCPT